MENAAVPTLGLFVEALKMNTAVMMRDFLVEARKMNTAVTTLGFLVGVLMMNTEMRMLDFPVEPTRQINLLPIPVLRYRGAVGSCRDHEDATRKGKLGMQGKASGLNLLVMGALLVRVCLCRVLRLGQIRGRSWVGRTGGVHRGHAGAPQKERSGCVAHPKVAECGVGMVYATKGSGAIATGG